MLFKELKVGDTIYVKNPEQWNKPIKKTIGRIESDVIWLLFHTYDGEFIGVPRAKSSQDSSYGIFVDFNAFKKYCINYHKNNVERIEVEMKKICEALENARQDLAAAEKMEEED